MDLSGLNTLMILLWKNFIFKRRQFVTVVVEIILTLLFAGALLLTRRYTTIKKSGPFYYSPQPVDELPLFLRPVPFTGLWELAFVPSKSVVVKDIVETVKKDLQLDFKVQGFSSEREFEDYVEQKNNTKRVLVAFVFDHEFKNSDDPLPLKVKYSLRLSRFQKNKYGIYVQPRSGETDVLFPASPLMGSRKVHDSSWGHPGYITKGFLLIQHALDRAIMKYHNHSAAEQLFKDVSVFIQSFPQEIYYNDSFFKFFGFFVPLVFLMIFSMNHFTLVQSIVWEKENRLKEYQLMIGLSNWKLWAAYFFTFLTFYSVVILLMCLVFFAKASLVPKLNISCSVLGIGIKWSNIFSPITVENFVFANVLGMFFFVAVLYGLVAWYIEAVFPGEYGVAKPWYFFLLRSHWCGKKPKGKNETKQFNDTTESKYFESEPTDLVAGIQLQHLYKEFRVEKTTKIAIRDLTLNLYEGQISVLLGPNGAGKSTTLSILSGLFPATSGEAYVNGYEISRQMVQIRKSLGLCPQQDLLFNYLTVSEHLYFYSVIKGVPRKMCLKEIRSMLSTFNLIEKRNAFPESLSGGMKRKLSIMIALIGVSKVVILDEPTAGMDPISRIATWGLLQKYKQDRTILLTTHYMDEADILGDRIAIMVKGTVRCCGSSVFLKQIYGVGYHITMVKEPHCNVEEISKLIYHYIPSATLEKDVKNELSFTLPKTYTHSFEALFTDLEKRQAELGIASFGASISTMEEVFFRVSDLEDSQTDIPATQRQPPSLMNEVSLTNQNKNMSRNERADSSTMKESPAILFNTGCALYQQQFWAMLFKRAMFNWRNWKLIFLQILAVLISLLFLCEMETVSSDDDDGKTRLMDLNQYGQTIVPLSISGNSNLTLVFLKHLKSMLEPGKHTLMEVQGDLLEYLMEDKDCIQLCIVAFSIEVKADGIIFTGLFNNEASHSPPLTLSMVDNVLFMSVSGPEASLTVSNKPQPYSILLLSGFCLLTVTERVSKAKHLQFMSGVYILVYWLSALLWDLILFFITCLLLLVMLKYCQRDIYLTDYHFLDTMLIFMLYGWSAIPIVYLLSFLFTKSSSAYIKLVLLNYLSGFFGLLIDSVLTFDTPPNMSNATRNFVLKSLLLFPNYNLAKCIIDYAAFHQMKKMLFCSKILFSPLPPFSVTTKSVYSLEEKMLGKYLIMMSVIGFVCFLLVFFWEKTLWKLRTFFNQCIFFGIYKKNRKELSGECEDEDVENERKRILGQPQEVLNSAVLIKELTKIYFKSRVILAVKNISVAVQKGECFGLLGFNGAGKTTTFQILTGEETATSGDVFIGGFNITDNIEKVRSYYRVGYCPQSDALVEYMTGRELIVMYARLWGVSESQIQLYVNKWLTSLQLEPHADKIISTYSGGTKRRLSALIALMGKTSVILLDEPSTGMDPVARRLLWDAVTLARGSGKAIIITSHRMEECDAFCTRLAIMVRGKFMCLGSPQHLKSKFGNIYILKVKVQMNTQKHELDDLKVFITETFPGSVLKQEHQGILNYYIPSKDNSWAKVFGILEEAKKRFNLEDYSASQIMLEQVFLSFASLQNTEDDQT
uniref:ABC transporter domain-containing protein n=1 Tax=Rhinolophus ferrumequinum TaxID=59479 RepID=A0A671G641_RHIFE